MTNTGPMTQGGMVEVINEQRKRWLEKCTSQLVTAKTNISLTERFLAWREGQSTGTDNKIENVEVEEVFFWVNGLQINPSSKRTYFLCIIGEIAKRRNRYFDETPLLKMIKKDLKGGAAAHMPSRAATVAPSALLGLFSAPHLGLAQVCFLVAARVGNLSGIKIIEVKNEKQKEEQIRVRYQWFRHKTLNHLGPKIREIVFPAREFAAAATLLKEKEGDVLVSQKELQKFEEEMSRKGLRKHTLRRSGLKYYQSKGMNSTDLMAISLHTSVDTMLVYLQ